MHNYIKTQKVGNALNKLKRMSMLKEGKVRLEVENKTTPNQELTTSQSMMIVYLKLRRMMDLAVGL